MNSLVIIEETNKIPITTSINFLNSNFLSSILKTHIFNVNYNNNQTLKTLLTNNHCISHNKYSQIIMKLYQINMAEIPWIT